MIGHFRVSLNKFSKRIHGVGEQRKTGERGFEDVCYAGQVTSASVSKVPSLNLYIVCECVPPEACHRLLVPPARSLGCSRKNPHSPDGRDSGNSCGRGGQRPRKSRQEGGLN